MKKIILAIFSAVIMLSATALATPLENYSFPHFEVDVKVKDFGSVNASGVIQNQLLGTSLTNGFSYDFGASLGLMGGFAVNAQFTNNSVSSAPAGMPNQYNSAELNLMYNVFSMPLLPSFNVFVGGVQNYNGSFSNTTFGDNVGWQVGANVVYSLPIICSVYASGAYGNTRATWEAGISVPFGIIFDIDAGYKYTQYGGTIQNSGNSLAFQGPFLGASFKL